MKTKSKCECSDEVKVGLTNNWDIFRYFNNLSFCPLSKNILIVKSGEPGDVMYGWCHKCRHLIVVGTQNFWASVLPYFLLLIG